MRLRVPLKFEAPRRPVAGVSLEDTVDVATEPTAGRDSTVAAKGAKGHDTYDRLPAEGQLA